MVIQSNRTLGGIGAVLTVVGAVSTVSSLFRYAYPNSIAANAAFSAVTSLFGVAAFVGFILLLAAMYNFSRDYGDHKIFNYILFGIIYTIVAAVIVGVIAIAVVLANLGSIIPNLGASTSSTQIQDMMLTYLGPFFAVFGFVGLIYVVFNVKAFNLLSDKSQVPLFRTGAKVLLAGGLLTTVLGIVVSVLAVAGSLSFNALLVIAIPGGLVQDAAWVLLAMAFFRIKVPPTETLTTSTPPVSGQVKYCTHCGMPNQLDSAYCTRCGQKL